MIDLFVIGLSVLFFAGSLAYVLGCDRLQRKRDDHA